MSPGSGTPGGPGDAVDADLTTAGELCDALLEVAGQRVVGVLLFGSRLARSSPGSHSAFDFVVLVDAYRPFYEELVAGGHHVRSPGTLSALARVLPPNVVPFLPDLPDEPVAKCIVVTRRDFERALSPSSPDHFLKGRMAQSVEILHVRDGGEREWLEGILAAGRRDVLRWAGARVDAPFSPAELARGMLRVSYRGEIRPEAGDRADEVYAAQAERLDEMYREVLEDAARRGWVEEVEPGRYRLASDPGLLARAGNRLYFARSKARATARWVKHVFTYPDWLTYIQRKVERRTGLRVEITERERRYPFVFLWPKVFRVLRARPLSASPDRDETS